MQPQKGGLTYEISNGGATITGCDMSASGDLVIPATLGGYPVTGIGEFAFYGCSNLVFIIFDDGVTGFNISPYPDIFDDCTSLSYIVIPDSLVMPNHLGAIFYGCTNLETFYYTGTKEQWEELALNLPEGVTVVYHTHDFSWGDSTTVAATCTKDGYTKYVCICGKADLQAIPALGHQYEAVVTPPTQQAQGYTTHTCANCGDSYQDSFVDALPAVSGWQLTNGVWYYYTADGAKATGWLLDGGV